MLHLNISIPSLRPENALILLLGLWVLLILSLQPGRIQGITNLGSPLVFFQGIRATFPLVVAGSAVAILACKSLGQRPQRFLFVGPVGLAAIYGVTGVAASTLSSDKFAALYWSVAYLSVPLVLWAIVSGRDTLDRAYRVASINRVIIVLGMATLFTTGILKLSLGGVIANPSAWLDCSPQPWVDLTSNFIRDTGVGRYAALAAIIALSRLWQPKWRSLWSIILLASLMLLLYSGARTALAGFAVAVPLVILLSGGRRAALASVVVVLALTPMVWATGIHDDFIDNCIFKQVRLSGSSTASQSQTTTPLRNPPTEKLTTPEQITPVAAVPPGKGDVSVQKPEVTGGLYFPVLGRIPEGFLTFSGRTKVWRDGLALFQKSPLLGYGFQADRLLLGTHAHNSLVHALLQTGLIGTIPLLAALAWGWLLVLKAVRNRHRVPEGHKVMVTEAGAVLAFLTIRTFTESTGAFFGVDLLLLGPILLYLQVVNFGPARTAATPQ